MNQANQPKRQCATCPAACSCGCQQVRTANACACGPQCRCAAPCNCAGG